LPGRPVAPDRGDQVMERCRTWSCKLSVAAAVFAACIADSQGGADAAAPAQDVRHMKLF